MARRSESIPLACSMTTRLFRAWLSCSLMIWASSVALCWSTAMVATSAMACAAEMSAGRILPGSMWNRLSAPTTAPRSRIAGVTLRSSRCTELRRPARPRRPIHPDSEPSRTHQSASTAPLLPSGHDFIRTRGRPVLRLHRRLLRQHRGRVVLRLPQTRPRRDPRHQDLADPSSPPHGTVRRRRRLVKPRTHPAPTRPTKPHHLRARLSRMPSRVHTSGATPAPRRRAQRPVRVRVPTVMAGQRWPRLPTIQTSPSDATSECVDPTEAGVVDPSELQSPEPPLRSRARLTTVLKPAFIRRVAHRRMSSQVVSGRSWRRR